MCCRVETVEKWEREPQTTPLWLDHSVQRCRANKADDNAAVQMDDLLNGPHGRLTDERLAVTTEERAFPFKWNLLSFYTDPSSSVRLIKFTLSPLLMKPRAVAISLRAWRKWGQTRHEYEYASYVRTEAFSCWQVILIWPFLLSCYLEIDQTVNF